MKIVYEIAVTLAHVAALSAACGDNSGLQNLPMERQAT